MTLGAGIFTGGREGAMARARKARDAADWLAAAAAYRKLLKRAGRDPVLWLELAQVLTHQGDRNAAQSAFLKALALDPGMTEVRDGLAALGWTGEQIAKAVTLCMHAKRMAAPPDAVERADFDAILPFFDSDWYRQTYPGIAEDADPVTHYLLQGVYRGYNPNALFDSDWYLATQPDVQRAGENPFAHFVRWGAAENRPGHPSFDPEAYCARAGLAGASVLEAMLHFINTGRAAGLKTTADAPEPSHDDEEAPGVAYAGEDSAEAFLSSNIYASRSGSLAKKHASLAIFAIHEASGCLQPFQLELLQALGQAQFDVVIVNSSIQNAESFLASALPLSIHVIVRHSWGRDFASWIAAMQTLERMTDAYEHVLWINDSILGPFRPLSEIVESMRQSDVDCYGLTDSWEHGYHLQSYFLLFKTAAFKNKCLQEFIARYEFPNTKRDIINEGELGLGKCLNGSSLSVRAYMPYADVAAQWLAGYEDRQNYYLSLPENKFGEAGSEIGKSGYIDHAITFNTDLASMIRQLQPANPTHYFWDTLIQNFGFPFVKRELLAKNPSRIPNIDQLSEVIGQPMSEPARTMIEKCLRVAGGNRHPPLPSPSETLAGKEGTAHR